MTAALRSLAAVGLFKSEPQTVRDVALAIAKRGVRTTGTLVEVTVGSRRQDGRTDVRMLVRFSPKPGSTLDVQVVQPLQESAMAGLVGGATCTMAFDRSHPSIIVVLGSPDFLQVERDGHLVAVPARDVPPPDLTIRRPDPDPDQAPPPPLPASPPPPGIPPSP